MARYARRLSEILAITEWDPVRRFSNDLRALWADGRQLFLCGNGGSGGNAIHLANDFVYGIGGGAVPGLRAHALNANAAILTCLGNDCGYETIFALQLRTLAARGDILLALSGSGNSPNIVAALEEARTLGVKSYAFLGYSGGRAKAMADVAMHFPVDDMQISEDLQVIAGHMAMQYLSQYRVTRSR